jgi:hypothetical protein
VAAGSIRRWNDGQIRGGRARHEVAFPRLAELCARVLCEQRFQEFFGPGKIAGTAQARGFEQRFAGLCPVLFDAEKLQRVFQFCDADLAGLLELLAQLDGFRVLSGVYEVGDGIFMTLRLFGVEIAGFMEVGINESKKTVGEYFGHRAAQNQRDAYGGDNQGWYVAVAKGLLGGEEDYCNQKNNRNDAQRAGQVMVVLAFTTEGFVQAGDPPGDQTDQHENGDVYVKHGVYNKVLPLHARCLALGGLCWRKAICTFGFSVAECRIQGLG